MGRVPSSCPSTGCTRLTNRCPPSFTDQLRTPDVIDDRFHDSCGVFGIFAPGHDVARLTYFGLYALQHRGQESAGIAVADADQVTVIKELGLVNQVFNEQTLSSLTGQHAIGHVRYSTTGSTHWQNSQPLVRSRNGSVIALGHNGNLVNTTELREELAAHGRTLQLRHRHRGHHGAHRRPGLRRHAGRRAHGRRQDPRRLQRDRDERGGAGRLSRPVRRAAALPGRLQRQRRHRLGDGRPGHHRRPLRARDRAGRDRHRGRGERAAQRAGGAAGGAAGALHLRVHLLRAPRLHHRRPEPAPLPPGDGPPPVPGGTGRGRPGHTGARHRHPGRHRLRRAPPASRTPRASSRTATSTAPSSSRTSSCARWASA